VLLDVVEKEALYPALMKYDLCEPGEANRDVWNAV
jgi:hypothetical protein